MDAKLLGGSESIPVVPSQHLIGETGLKFLQGFHASSHRFRHLRTERLGQVSRLD
jgi:hypothetical protein